MNERLDSDVGDVQSAIPLPYSPEPPVPMTFFPEIFMDLTIQTPL
jgi:hypothetical protein